MSRMSTISLSVAIIIWAAVAHITCANECPNLKPVDKIDEDFIFQKQPDGGFYCSIASGYNSMPSYTPKPMSIVKVDKKLCAKGQMHIASGSLSVPCPDLQCHFSTISEYYCNAKGNSASGLSTVGVQVPKAVKYTIVDTDNSSFLALGQCFDGALYTWAILTTDPNFNNIRASTLRALKITQEMVKESQGKRLRCGRLKLVKGECTGDGASPMSALGNGLGGLFGRK